jgi:outer membrane protein
MKSVLFLTLFLLQTQAHALTLKESFESALRTNELDNINNALINQNEEIRKENRGNYFPKLYARGTYLKQDNVDIDQKTVGLNLAHTIYRGGRDRLLVESSEKSIAIAENQKISDRLSLYLSVIQAYYNYFLNLNDYKNLELLKKQSSERVNETSKRVRVGRTRRGELLQAQAQLATADAQIFNGAGLLKESEERFFRLTGLNRTNNNFTETISIPSEMKPLSFYLDSAYSKADVKNRELRIELAELDVSQAKAQFLPTLDLASNYYFNKRNSTTFRDSKWDVGLTLNFPLFEGGANRARLNEQVQKREQAIYTLNDTKKNIEIEISGRYETFRRYMEQIQAYELAFDKTQSSYEETLRDYRLGLVSNLDVLSSLNLYLDSKRNNEKTKIQALMSLRLLEAAAGVLP